ncbi:hypothetical protein EZV62_018960 [Acer yangbiense]|uniref:GDSL esterase/lipase n=1 Tax=Acer yangbiense TaxID=1000413 RepID=A0A5C7H9T8_9ROSI|nr:hypothetical protein EZV62_018960 [Acer yangbiense]
MEQRRNRDGKATWEEGRLSDEVDLGENYGPDGGVLSHRGSDSELLGFDNSIPSFARARGDEILKGVNYASGAYLGARISLNKQLKNHRITVSRIRSILGDNKSTANLLSKCIYTVGMGNNDYINNYFSQYYPTRSMYTPEQYSTLLFHEFSHQLKILYNLGARKVAVFGIGVIGCTPGMIAMYGTNGSLCVDFVNNAVQLFNAKLIPLVEDFNKNMLNSTFIFVDSYQIALTPTLTTGVKSFEHKLPTLHAVM